MKTGVISTDSVFHDPEFPVSVRRVVRHSPHRLHRHDFHELVLILDGKGRHRTANDAYPISAGDVFVIMGDIAHGYADTDRMALVNVLFLPEALALQASDLGDVPGYHTLFTVEPQLRGRSRLRARLRLTPEQLAVALPIVTGLEEELARRGPGYRFMARTHLMHLIGFLSRCYSQHKVGSEKPLLGLGEVLSYIEQHYDRPVTIADLTRMAAMSESTFMRTFRRVMGCSPIEHLIHVRIARASELLTRTDMRITEIAFACGFNDANYFSRQFRRVTGRSPRQFRRDAD